MISKWFIIYVFFVLTIVKELKFKRWLLVGQCVYAWGPSHGHGHHSNCPRLASSQVKIWNAETLTQLICWLCHAMGQIRKSVQFHQFTTSTLLHIKWKSWLSNWWENHYIQNLARNHMACSYYTSEAPGPPCILTMGGRIFHNSKSCLKNIKQDTVFDQSLSNFCGPLSLTQTTE